MRHARSGPPYDILESLTNVEGEESHQEDSPANDTVNIPDEEAEEEGVELFTAKEGTKLEQVKEQSVVDLR